MTDRYRSNRSNRSAYAEDRVVQIPDLSESLWRAVSGYRPHRYPRSTGILALWLFGLFAVFFSPAPVKITQEKLDRYTQLVTQVGNGILSLKLVCQLAVCTNIFLYSRLRVTPKYGQ